MFETDMGEHLICTGVESRSDLRGQFWNNGYYECDIGVAVDGRYTYCLPIFLTIIKAHVLWIVLAHVDVDHGLIAKTPAEKILVCNNRYQYIHSYESLVKIIL